MEDPWEEARDYIYVALILYLVCRNALEDPWEEAREDMYTRSVSPEQAPDKATYIDLEFEGGNPVAIDGQQLSPASLLTQLNKVTLAALTC